MRNNLLNKKEEKELEEYNKKIAEFFGMPLEDFKIEIATKEKIKDITKKDYKWLISVVDRNKIYILPRNEISKDFFETIKHELVHIYVHKKFPQTMGFIDEGLAEYFSRPYKREWQKELLKEDSDIIQFMIGAKKRYLSAFSLVYFLIKNFGKEKLFLLASKLKPFNKMSTKEANSIFLSVLKIDIPTFEKQWRQFIKNEST